MNIKSLAELCGVSVSTVSRALNGHPDVNPAVRERVLQTAKAHHYVPNNAARDLVSRRTDAMGLVIRGLGNIFFTPVIQSIEKTAQERGYTVVTCQINTDDDELMTGAALARSKKLKGLIFLGGRCDYTPAQTEILSVPFVCCTYRNSFGSLAQTAYSSVTVDDEAAAFDAVRYLLEKGHRRVAILLSSAGDHSVGALRYAGYKKALESFGLSVDPALVAEAGGYSLHRAYNAMKRLIDGGAEFTALFAAADTMALAAERALYDAGRKVPADCSVIAIDGLSVTQYTVPVLTTLIQPAAELGATAVSLLLELTEGGGENRHVLVRTALRPGESVREIR